MPISIGNNIASLNAQRQLGKATDKLAGVFERLSSGLRINKASDDAAGLAIADGLKASSRVYTQAIRNVNDGVSYLSIAQGALANLSDITTRQKELAEQAANGTYSVKQKLAMQNESNQLTKEYNRVVQSSSFNGIKVLNGSNASLRIQQGYGTTESTKLNVGTNFGFAAGDGTFQTRVSLVDGPNSASTAVGDLNGDGIMDFATADAGGTGPINIFLGNGDGTFKAPLSIATAGGLTSISIADFNNDGKADLVVGETGSNVVDVVLGNGNGTFRGIQTLTTFSSAGHVITGDFNNDGIADIISSGSSSTLSVMIGNGDGTFKGYTLANSQLINASNYVAADFDGDGILDLASSHGGAGGIITFLKGNGDGSFKAGQTYSIGNSLASSVSASDLNGDGFIDLITSNTSSTVITVMMGCGNGTFSPGQSYTAGLSPQDLDIADFNGDGIMDIASADNASNTVSILIGNGDGSFGTRQFFSDGAGPYGIISADFNGDGVLDLVTNDAGVSGVSIFLGNADGTGRRNNLQSNLDLINRSGALSALDSTTRLLDKINLDVGVIGASLSRLSTSNNVLNVTKENQQSAESRIRDADVAEEAANLSSTKILQQVAASVLAQANLQPQLALSLLRN